MKQLNNMKIKQSVLNTFERVGIDYKPLVDDKSTVEVANRFSGVTCETSQLVAKLITWVYQTNNEMDMGISEVKISDFDRIRHFIAEIDSNAYMNCID